MAVGALTDLIQGPAKTAGTVLVVDDEAGVARVLTMLLASRGHRVLTAPDLAGAWRLCAAERPDLVLVDKNLPDGDGAAAVAGLRQASGGASVLVMTAHPTVSSAVGAVAAGAQDYITKPFDLNLLLGRVEDSIGRRRQQAARDAARHQADRLHELFEVVLDSMAEPVIAHDPLGQILCANRAARELYGFGDDAPPEWIDALERDRDTMQVLRRRVHRGESVPEHRARRVRADGTQLDVMVSMRPLARRGVAESHGILEISRSVADMVRAQAAVVETEKMKSLGRLTAGIAHEINNPISYVLSNVERLREYGAQLARVAEASRALVAADEAAPGAAAPAPAAARAEVRDALAALQRDGVLEELGPVLDDVRDGARQVATIVRDIRQLARTSNGRVERVDPAAIMEQAASVMRGKLKRVSEVQRETAAPGEGAGAVFGMQERLVQVVINLLDNACYAVEKGGGTRITLRVRWLEERVRLEVEDDGPGVPADARARLFDPFFTTKPPGEGTGLGLSIAYQIAREHGGRLLYETGTDGRGARFVLELPAPSLRGRAVLAVETEDVEVPRDALEAEGSTVEVVRRACDAQAALAVRRFDVVVVPCGTQWPSGFELLAEVRRNHPSTVRVGVHAGSATWNGSARDDRADLWTEDLLREPLPEILGRALALQHASEAF
ncbi:MAG TPA: response regulator [Myxococcota bacterium]|jgi:PAS domain S-box-containing protein|nr:response regulator [Myxococcota bacterium]